MYCTASYKLTMLHKIDLHRSHRNLHCSEHPIGSVELKASLYRCADEERTTYFQFLSGPEYRTTAHTTSPPDTILHTLYLLISSLAPGDVSIRAGRGARGEGREGICSEIGTDRLPIFLFRCKRKPF
jgi:hypothetical protein